MTTSSPSVSSVLVVSLVTPRGTPEVHRALMAQLWPTRMPESLRAACEQLSERIREWEMFLMPRGARSYARFGRYTVRHGPRSLAAVSAELDRIAPYDHPRDNAVGARRS
jgi:hypothetical protein